MTEAPTLAAEQPAILFVERPPLLIGLIGAAGAGKSTVASYLEDEHAFAEIGFADPIVNMLGQLFAEAGIGGEWMTERALKELPTPLGFSYRALAQTLGTEWGRHLSPDFWLRVAMHKVAELHHQGDDVVLSDCRFPNEAEWIHAQGGVLVRIVRDGAQPVRTHESESHVAALPADHELLNHAGLDSLFDQVDRLMRHLRS